MIIPILISYAVSGGLCETSSAILFTFTYTETVEKRYTYCVFPCPSNV